MILPIRVQKHLNCYVLTPFRSRDNTILLMDYIFTTRANTLIDNRIL